MGRPATVAFLTVCTIGVLITILVTVLMLAPTIHWGEGSVTEIGQTRASLTIVLAGSVQAFCLLAILIAVGWDDLITRRHISRLYPPLVFTSTGIVLVLVLSGLSAFVLLQTDLRAPWLLLREPEVRALHVLGLAIAVIGMGWKAWIILAGRGWPCSRIVCLYAAQAVLTIAIVAVAVWGSP